MTSPVSSPVEIGDEKNQIGKRTNRWETTTAGHAGGTKSEVDHIERKQNTERNIARAKYGATLRVNLTVDEHLRFDNKQCERQEESVFGIMELDLVHLPVLVATQRQS